MDSIVPSTMMTRKSSEAMVQECTCEALGVICKEESKPGSQEAQVITIGAEVVIDCHRGADMVNHCKADKESDAI